VTPLRLVPLVWVADPFEAKVLAARLGSEGIVWQLRGNVDSVYPLGGVEVLVDEADLDDARQLLDLVPAEAPEDAPTRRSWPFAVAGVAMVLVVSWARVRGWA
jgi:hypothetical protein